MFERQPQIHKRPTALTSTTSCLLLGCLSFILIFSNQAYADTNLGHITTYVSNAESNKIAVILSQACVTALKHNLNTGCPTYKDLSPPDNTNTSFFGKIVLDKHGYYGRTKALIPNYYNVVASSDWIVGVDPTDQFIEGSLTRTLIVMAPGSLSSYASPDAVVGSNHTRIEYHDRFVNNICTEARIAYTYTLYIDTINYLKSGCKTTNYKDHEDKPINNTPFKMNSPYASYVMDAYLKQVLHGHQYFSSVNRTNAGGLGPSNCINHQCSYTDPNAKVGYR